MTIQSDAQIEQLCTPPKVTFDKWNYDNDIKVANQAGAIPMEEPAYSEWFEALRQRWSYPTPADLAWKPMISPFVSVPTRTVKSREVRGGEICFDERKVISFGLTSYGYDVRLAEEFKIFTNVNSVSIDPKCLDEKCLVTADIHEDPDGSLFVWLPPNSYMLGRTVEYFVIPRDIFIVCLGKSTYARAGAIVNVTPIEPGFEGNVVIEISNSTNLPLKVYANEGISQFVFLKGDQPCRLSYADKGGKYQFQQGITLPRA